jgi:hypothetical protein
MPSRKAAEGCLFLRRKLMDESGIECGCESSDPKLELSVKTPKKSYCW